MPRIHVTPTPIDPDADPVVPRQIPSKDHGRRMLPDAGDWVDYSPYWARRLAQGDVVQDPDAIEPAEPEPEPEPAPPPAPRAKKPADPAPLNDGVVS